MLASGRPGIGFWVSPKADGAEWIGYDVEAEHSKNLPSDPWDAAHGTGTTSYTGIAEVEPGVVLLACVPLVTVLPRVLNLSRAVLRVAVVHRQVRQDERRRALWRCAEGVQRAHYGLAVSTAAAVVLESKRPRVLCVSAVCGRRLCR